MIFFKVTKYPVFAAQCRNIALSANSYFEENVPLNRTLCMISRNLTNQLRENNELIP
jgi:hypothetical protein